eukprot:scaffold6898_cov123-Cylindrotheca_fusiformis.AAC.8
MTYDSSDEDASTEYESASSREGNLTDDDTSGTSGSSAVIVHDTEDSDEDDDSDSDDEDTDGEGESTAFRDEHNQYQHNSNIATYDVEKSRYGDDPLSPIGNDDPEAEKARRRKVVIILSACLMAVTVIGIALGIAVFGGSKDDGEASPSPTTSPPTTMSPTTPAPTPAPTTPEPTVTASNAPTPVPYEFVFDVVADTFIQVGNDTSQATSDILLVENGNSVDNFDAFALLEMDLSVIRNRRRDLQITTQGLRTYYLRLILAKEYSCNGGLVPKLSLLKLDSTLDITQLQEEDLRTMLVEPVTEFRYSNLRDPTVPENVFEPIVGEAGDEVWIGITDVVESTKEDTLNLMIQNRDATESFSCAGVEFYSSDSDFPPALVVLVEPIEPTASLSPSLSSAPSNAPPTSQPSVNPSTSMMPSIKDSASPSSGPSESKAPSQAPSESMEPSTSARPTGIASAVPSLRPSASPAPSTSAKPSVVESSAPSQVSDLEASEYPTDTGCQACHHDDVFKYSLAKPWPDRPETCADLRLKMLQNMYFLYDASPEDCAAVKNKCECEQRQPPCIPCTEEGAYFDNPTVIVNGVSCQEAQMNLAVEPNAYGPAQCSLLQSTCLCLPPQYTCNLCGNGQTMHDPNAIVETSIATTSCSQFGMLGKFGYISEANCDALKAEGIADTCECAI